MQASQLRVVRRVRRAGAVILVVAILFGAAGIAPFECDGGMGCVLAWTGSMLGTALLILIGPDAFELFELGLRAAPEAQTTRTVRAAERRLSIHVPICSEPPEVVERTLRSLHALRYDPFEVIVVDNNTADAALWRPVERLCRELGPKFRFFHLARWPGYKAGALNFALAQTSSQATLIAVVDSDYEVAQDFVHTLIGHFDSPNVAFVQAPQDYREWEGSTFMRMCYWEYWQFFAVSMRLRHARNAILMHGTMVMIRKSTLIDVGGWAEWCLTEDSELGLRLLAAGHRGVYCASSLGLGLVPFSSRDYKCQRARWVTGGMQTLARHWRKFLPWAPSLTGMQKLHFLQGWAPWLRDGVIVGSVPLAFALGAFSLSDRGSPAPLLPLATVMVVVVGYLGLREFLVYRPFLKRPWRDAIGAAVAIVGLIPTTGASVIGAMFRRHLTFNRTPKQAPPVQSTSRQLACESLAVAVATMLAGLLLVRFGWTGVLPAAGMMAYATIFASSVATELISRRLRVAEFFAEPTTVEDLGRMRRYDAASAQTASSLKPTSAVNG